MQRKAAQSYVKVKGTTSAAQGNTETSINGVDLAWEASKPMADDMEGIGKTLSWTPNKPIEIHSSEKPKDHVDRFYYHRFPESKDEDLFEEMVI